MNGRQGGREAQAVPEMRNNRCTGYSSIPGCKHCITYQAVHTALSKLLFVCGTVSKHPELLQDCEETLLSEKACRNGAEASKVKGESQADAFLRLGDIHNDTIH